MRYYAKPDVKAPRYRPQRHIVLSKDFVKRLKEKYPNLRDLSHTEIRKVISKFNELMYKTIINTRDGLELPNNLGYLFVGACQRPTWHNKDYSKSALYLTDIRHRNFESDEKLAKIFYSNYQKKYLFRNRDLWEFKGHRNFTREVAKTFPENWNRYVQVDKNKHISRILKKEKAKEIAKILNPMPDNYDEFNLI